jgi:hypothetical protein
MNYIQKISSALDKETENISFLAYFPSTKLQQKLTLVKKQIEIATRNEQTDALELLKLWETQITEAQLLKQQLNPDENPLLEMDFELPEIMAFELIEKRQELLRQKLLKEEFVSTTQK